MCKDDREEEISQSDAEPMMTMNILVRNADDVAEFVSAVVLISARNSFDGTSCIITDAPSHDERVVAARDEFMDVNDEEVSDEDGCLSRSMTIKAHRRIIRERIMISRVASEVSFSDAARGTCDNSAKEAEFASRVLPARRHRWSADTNRVSR